VISFKSKFRCLKPKTTNKNNKSIKIQSNIEVVE
jgi:hypothetical protein